MNTPKKFRVWLPSLNKFGDDNSVFMDCYGKLYGVTRPSLVDDSRSIVNIGQFKEFDGYTIQWYTGLTDKNGKEICEGDILEWKGEFIAEVFFEQENAAFVIKSKTDGKAFMSENYVLNFQIIGNIFEHSELLK